MKKARIKREVTMNTKERGKFTIFAYQYKQPNYYIGVCLEFDLITEGKTLIEAKKNIFHASVGYLLTIIKNNLSDKLLNFTPDPIYLREYIKLLKRRTKTIERIRKEKKQKSENLIPWDKYFSQQDIPYSKDLIKEFEKEEACV